MVECWSCHRIIKPDEETKIGFLGLALCPKCTAKHDDARNYVRLQQWEAAFEQLSATKQRRLP